MNKKLALVTGGIKGIGKAISVKLKEKGYEVIANYLKEDNLAKEFSLKYGITTYKFDVSNFNECQEAISKIEKDFGKNIEILVNNAGVIADHMFHKMPIEDFFRVVNVNLDSCFNMCKIIYPKMRENGFGRIVNIASINAITGQIGQTNYVASKAAIIGFTKSLAKECATKGVTVNAVSPGYTNTAMLHSIDEEILEKIISTIPAKRLASPEEIAHAVAFLISEESGYITGTNLNVNGGQFM